MSRRHRPPTGGVSSATKRLKEGEGQEFMELVVLVIEVIANLWHLFKEIGLLASHMHRSAISHAENMQQLCAKQ